MITTQELTAAIKNGVKPENQLDKFLAYQAMIQKVEEIQTKRDILESKHQQALESLNAELAEATAQCGHPKTVDHEGISVCALCGDIV